MESNLKFGNINLNMEYRVKITPEDGWFLIKCIDLPSCFSQGRSEKEAIEMIKDALEGYIECMNDMGHNLPSVSGIVVV